MPKLGFVDCMSNAFDSLDLANSIIEKSFAGTTLKRLTAPEILKIPVCAKKLFSKDCDAVIAFVTAIPDDLDSLHLLVEKTIDLELEFQKYVFYCVVSEEEFSTEAEFNKVTEKKLEAVIDLALKALHSPQEVSDQIGTGMDFSMFASFAGEQNAPDSQEVSGTTVESEDSDRGKSLF
ncbi:MAG: hypothetical protein V1722_04685 [Candidatus Micrarchaeota archaeon]